MKEIIFDIKNFSYLTGELPDVSFIPMMTRRKLDNFGRAALCTLYKVFENSEVALVFSSCFGDFERVKKLTTQLKEEGEVSPAGFSASVHNASVGLFSILEKIKTGYNAISAGEKSFDGVKIYWKWAYETDAIATNDPIDTGDGEAANTLTIGVDITGVQTEPSTTAITSHID